MKIVQTKDGSNTVVHSELGEHYHSVHGALQESKHVFIEYGLNQVQSKTKICVFEMGFGTGLNALLSYEFAQLNEIEIYFVSIEAFPLDAKEALSLEYANLIDDTDVFRKMQDALWNAEVKISGNFTLLKIHGLLEETDLSFLPEIDVIFFDAFAPSAQEHLWRPDILKKMFDLLCLGGHLTTYCAKGQFKRDLKSVGFEVKAVPGPPGKREMTLAYK